ncbi:lactadherin isoform X1 [Hippopotamus amphibius kiboko]|uniref:lactadherin isoform X1 n=1 Tax=Hippopotamus amphibius kiboko TaxID=575201 RepID=UPI00259819B6|nr:lactadherin isoform X1 [Hippopotamus amphibius kiboko]
MPAPRLLAALCGALLCAPGLFAFSGDFCDSSQCLHGGTCLLDQDKKPPFHCLCPEGFTGLICNETERGPCFPNPCHSDAECEVIDDSHRGDVFTQYICKCPLGYVGIHCEIICTSPLGMETGAIADSQISASSVHLGFMGLQRWAPEMARLHNTGIVNAWTSSNYDRNPWIQVNLMRKMRVTGVVTQGASRAGSAEYLKTFKVAYSTNGRKFHFIQGAGESGDKIFMGNVDNSGLKVNLFEIPLEVQYVRLVPIICHRGCTLRFELLGCELNGLGDSPPLLAGCAEPLGLKNNTIPNKQITASSFYKTWGLSAFSWYPSYARLDNQGKFNAWTAQTNSASEWLQVDLGSEKRVTGIVTQGARDFGHIQYVAAYKVAYSDDAVSWTEYRDPGAVESKIFPGNLDNNSHKKNMLEAPIVARFVRILPVAWHNRITLRVELLGC